MTSSTQNRCWFYLLFLLAYAVAGLPAQAQQDAVLEEIMVTAQRRAENVQDVPISVTPLSGERLTSIFEGGEDIRALAARLPSLYAESSNGRLAPRFYIRGLGNTDFDLAASQPVSIIVDEVVLENVVLKSSPLFDLDRVEVLRGPQGTLFGRNTPAGIIKFDTRKPSQESDGYFTASYGTFQMVNLEGAFGGGLTDTLSTRVSYLFQHRGDFISNGFTGENNAMGGFEELAYRAQLLWEPNDQFSGLLNLHGRDYEGTSAIFRANVLGPGSDGFNSNFDRDQVFFDAGDNNPQSANGFGGSLKLVYDINDETTITSISAHETSRNKSLGDIDGGFGADFLPSVGPCPPGSTPGVDPCIPFPSATQDGIDNLDQFTQEIRIASQASDQLFWQAGVFYFDSEFTVTTEPGFVAPTSVSQENTSWAVFGHASYDVNDLWTLTGGVRWTDDDKDLMAFNAPIPQMPTSVSDDEISWDISALYNLNDDTNLYGRIARGFRAPSIQGRDIAFFGSPSVAKSETILSVEGGVKADLAGGRARINGSVFYYQIDDQQLTAVGGGGNFVRLVNADKGTGMGFDVDGEFLLTDNFIVTGGVSYNDTEIEDSVLAVPPCPTGQCTVIDALDANGNAIVDGNPFPNAPEWVLTFTARYSRPFGSGNEFFVFTDWSWQGDTQLLLYDAREYRTDGNFEGGLRVGWSGNDGGYEVAAFARNITDEENVKGAIDFNNLTGFGNEPRILGVSFKLNFPN